MKNNTKFYRKLIATIGIALLVAGMTRTSQEVAARAIADFHDFGRQFQMADGLARHQWFSLAKKSTNHMAIRAWFITGTACGIGARRSQRRHC